MDIIANDEIKADTTYKGKSCTTVTIGVIAYNEQQLLPALLDSFEKQTYPHELIDIILVDGNHPIIQRLSWRTLQIKE